MGHPNLSLVFLVPLAAYLVVRLLDGSCPRGMVIPLLGVVLGAQLYISTETFATLTLMGGLFALIGLAPSRAVAAAAPGGASARSPTAYARGGRRGHPLFYAAAAWPRPYKPILFATIGHGAPGRADFLRYLIPGRFTLLWDGSHWGGYGNPWYLGVPLLVLLILFVVTERGRRSTWLLAAGLLVTLVLSIGDTLGGVRRAHPALAAGCRAAAAEQRAAGAPGGLRLPAHRGDRGAVAGPSPAPRPALGPGRRRGAGDPAQLPGDVWAEPGAGPGLPDPGDLPPLPAAGRSSGSSTPTTTGR